MRLFIIGGKANVGKNTLAKYIKEYYDEKDEKSIITEYSKYVKLMANEMIDWYGKKKPRLFLQNLGEEIRKTIDPNIFIERMKEDILIYQKYYNNIIICDARLIPELTLMKTKYSKCYTIHLISKRENNLTNEEKNHITETEFDNYKNFDFELENNSLDELKNKVYEMLDKIKE
ncbi:MAG: hypothetical protein IJ572_02500 [Bacilli bacterium]|nr:hypothetical protein [Bacilli bacterium]